MSCLLKSLLLKGQDQFKVLQCQSEENIPSTLFKVCQFFECIPSRQQYKKPLRQALPFKLYGRSSSMVIAVFPEMTDGKLF